MDVVALDDFFDPTHRIDLIKMDIQGSEGLALAGMKRILSSTPGIMLIMEFWPKGLALAGSAPTQVLADLLAMGLMLEYIDEQEKKLVTIENIESFVASLTKEQYVSIMASAGL